MKTPKWTKADAKRAEKMGWKLVNYTGDDPGYVVCTGIERSGDRFKSDEEAIEWVINQVQTIFANYDTRRTCRKALFLCAKG